MSSSNSIVRRLGRLISARMVSRRFRLGILTRRSLPTEKTSIGVGQIQDIPFGQIDKEYASDVRRDRNIDLAAQLLHNRLGDAQAQASATFLARIRRVGLSEFLEQPLAKRLGNARATIMNRDSQHFATAS